MAKIKNIQALFLGKTDNEITISLADIIREIGELSKSYKHRSAYFTKQDPFYSNCIKCGYIPVELNHNSIAVGRQEEIDLECAVEYCVVFQKIQGGVTDEDTGNLSIDNEPNTPTQIQQEDVGEEPADTGNIVTAEENRSSDEEGFQEQNSSSIQNNETSATNRGRKGRGNKIKEPKFKYYRNKTYKIDRLSSELQNLKNKGVKLCLENELQNEYKRYSVFLVKLSNDNSDIIEQSIKENDNYKFSFAKIVFDSFCKPKGKKFPIDNRDAVFAVMRMIDSDNSTNAWRMFRETFMKMLDYIMDKNNKFFKKLKEGKIELVSELMNCVKNEAINISSNDENGRIDVKAELLSFSSKICTYLNRWIYGKDDYYIYDYYVAQALPYYCDRYGITGKKDEYVRRIGNSNKNFDNNKSTYELFFELIKKVHDARDKEFRSQMSKECLDHIMWYSYRGFSK